MNIMRKINRNLSQSKQYKNYEKIIFNYFTDYHQIGNVGTGHNCYAYRFNVTPSKYKGTGAGNAEKNRL